jgi:poly(3-hydroxybutyrate) depolymerase
MKKKITAVTMATAVSALGAAAGGIPGWPKEVVEISYLSAADNTRQPALFYAPPGAGAKPLLVALHTWSNDHRQSEPAYADWCIRQGWYFIRPNFRGPNKTPQALGSDLAVADVVSAVNYVAQTGQVDNLRIYLVGASGGGHMALLMAGRHPEIWAGVSAWCGIADIRRWWEERTAIAGPTDRYAGHIEAACGGKPDTNPKAAEECRQRSPLTYLTNAASVNLDIATGVKDGRSGSVPFSHSLRAFNAVAPAGDRIAEEAIRRFSDEQKAPGQDKTEIVDPLYGGRKIVFRKTARLVRVTIFDGGHEILHPAALHWLAAQRKGRPAVWDVPAPATNQVPGAETTVGR